jgi:hypothetical protein
MNLTDEQKLMVIDFGLFGYDARKISSILGIDITIIEGEKKKKGSEFNELYQKGIDMGEYVIDQKLFELAKTGDLKALNKLEFRRRNRI